MAVITPEAILAPNAPEARVAPNAPDATSAESAVKQHPRQRESWLYQPNPQKPLLLCPKLPHSILSNSSRKVEESTQISPVELPGEPTGVELGAVAP